MIIITINLLYQADFSSKDMLGKKPGSLAWSRAWNASRLICIPI